MTSIVSKSNLRRLLGGRSSRAKQLQPSFALACGWLLIFISPVPVCAYSRCIVCADYLAAAISYALTILIFLSIIRPCLGSFYQWRYVVSSVLIFSSCTIMISFTLGNHGDAIVVHAYHWLQAHAISWLSKLVGSLPAQLLLTPLYLFSVVLFAIAFACQSRGALAVIVAALLGCGVSPLNVPLILGDLLLLSGFYLVSNECLHLPRWIEERLELTEAQRELLTELEKRPLSEAEVRFFLSEDEPSSSKAASGNVVRQLRELGAAGLVEYSQQNKRFHATEVLKKSTAAIAVAWLANAIAWAGALGLLLLAVAYDLLPLHLPGFLDDIVVTILGAVPLYLKIRQQLKRLS